MVRVVARVGVRHLDQWRCSVALYVGVDPVGLVGLERREEDLHITTHLVVWIVVVAAVLMCCCCCCWWWWWWWWCCCCCSESNECEDSERVCGWC